MVRRFGVDRLVELLTVAGVQHCWNPPLRSTNPSARSVRPGWRPCATVSWPAVAVLALLFSVEPMPVVPLSAPDVGL